MRAPANELKELHLWTEGGLPIADAGQMQPYLRWVRPNDRILDIGCGDGRVLRFLLQHGHKADGVDLNAELIAMCRADGLPVEQRDARETVSSCAERYGVFSMLDFIEHIPMETAVEILRAIAARPGARVWIQTPNLDSLMGFKFWFHMPTHVLALHPWVLRRMLDRLGFRILAEWTDYGGLPWTGLRRWLTLKIINGLFGPPLANLFLGGGNICLVAEALPPSSNSTHSVCSPEGVILRRS